MSFATGSHDEDCDGDYDKEAKRYTRDAQLVGIKVLCFFADFAAKKGGCAAAHFIEHLIENPPAGGSKTPNGA